VFICIYCLFFSTYLGEPIPYDPDVTPEVLAERVDNFVLNKEKSYFSMFRLKEKLKK
jgi:hypothetical protein